MSEISNVTIKQAAEILLNNDDYYILCHANPDGDTFGCGYGLCSALQSIGKHARVVCADELSSRFAYMKDAIKEQEFEPKTIISVDVADKKLLGSLEEVYGDKVFLAIDHHLSHVPFAENRLVESFAAAACETVYQVITEMGITLDKGIATCLYTGLATDTGCFRYPNTTPRTHMIAAETMRFDFNYGDLNYILFEMRTKSRLKLELDAINRLEFFAGDKGALTVLTTEMIESVDSEDINGIAALPRMIEGVEVGLVIKQRDEKVWKVSMRSRDKVDVQSVCKQFGGGGHIRAAGCTVEGSIDEVRKAVIGAVTKAIKEAE